MLFKTLRKGVLARFIVGAATMVFAIALQLCSISAYRLPAWKQENPKSDRLEQSRCHFGELYRTWLQESDEPLTKLLCCPKLLKFCCKRWWMRSLQNGTTGKPWLIVFNAQPLSKLTKHRRFKSNNSINRFICPSNTDGWNSYDSIALRVSIYPEPETRTAKVIK